MLQSFFLPKNINFNNLANLRQNYKIVQYFLGIYYSKTTMPFVRIKEKFNIVAKISQIKNGYNR